MAKVAELLARMLARERRKAELMASLIDGMAREESSEDEDEVERMRILRCVYEKVCVVEAKLCAIEAGLEEVAAAEQLVTTIAIEIEVSNARVPMIEIGVAMTAAAAAALMFERAVTAELTAAAVVWWGGCGERVVMGEEVVKFTDWMREWEAMVRWCGGGWWSRPLLIE